MYRVVLCSLVLGIASAVHYNDLAVSSALQNPRLLLNLYQQYSVKEGKAKSPQRLALFRSTLKKIAKCNAKHLSWTQGLNMFSDMTVEEKRSYLGLNSSALHRTLSSNIVHLSDIPESKDWRAEGKVTGVKDQGGCGACWTFGAVGPIETNYAILTGKRKSFAEKEYLDCVYNWNRGCDGGFYEDCWDYSEKHGRLALTRDAPYYASDQYCGGYYNRQHNALIAAKITGYYTIPPGEDNMISFLAKGAVGTAFEVTDDFFNYQKGIIKDTTCDDMGDTTANHAVTAVGYTPNSMIVKNSWGTSWGMGGYFETARGTDLCEHFSWGAVPTWILTGQNDNDPDYVPSDGDDCEGTNADGCACGTVRCGDGICRHAHMC
ncbi:uncharacterized protein LOC134820997 [Bolinopsis microptera]|uniref:uncharacterized protein LOC134820997 n=1 Tax=Bolinopsis microptera TaxID=2820187 RepID=UPI00307B0AEA